MDETFGIPSTSLTTSLPFSTQKGAVSRSPSWLVRPLTEPYHLQSEKTRDKDLKKHDDLDHQAHSLRVVDLGFKITFAVVMMTGVRVTESIFPTGKS